MKIDINKAYDRVDWAYVEQILRKLGFSRRWIGWMMMMCVRSVRYSVQVNKDSVGPIIPGRGLRQGDPLSPYLFILCTEGLSMALNSACSQSECPRNQPPLLCSDSLLFCRATMEEGHALRNILDEYESILARQLIMVSRTSSPVKTLMRIGERS